MLGIIVGSVLTTLGLVVLGFIAFFLTRLIKQLDKNTDNLETVAKVLAVLESRVSSLEHKTVAIPTRTEEDVA